MPSFRTVLRVGWDMGSCSCVVISQGSIFGRGNAIGCGVLGEKRNGTANFREFAQIYCLGKWEIFHHEGTKDTKRKEIAALRDVGDRSVIIGMYSFLFLAREGAKKVGMRAQFAHAWIARRGSYAPSNDCFHLSSSCASWPSW